MYSLPACTASAAYALHTFAQFGFRKNANFANLYVSIFGYVSDEGGVVLLDEEGGEKTWTQTIPAVWTIVN